MRHSVLQILPITNTLVLFTPVERKGDTDHRPVVIQENMVFTPAECRAGAADEGANPVRRGQAPGS